VKEVLDLPLVKEWTQQRIADMCDVSQWLVSQLDDRAAVYRDNKPPTTPAPAQGSDSDDEESESEPASNGQATSTRGKPKDPTRPAQQTAPVAVLARRGSMLR
jgi:hypothetical protein